MHRIYCPRFKMIELLRAMKNFLYSSPAYVQICILFSFLVSKNDTMSYCAQNEIWSFILYLVIFHFWFIVSCRHTWPNKLLFAELELPHTIFSLFFFFRHIWLDSILFLRTTKAFFCLDWEFRRLVLTWKKQIKLRYTEEEKKDNLEVAFHWGVVEYFSPPPSCILVMCLHTFP